MDPLTVHLLIYLGGSALVALHHYLSTLLASLLFFCLLLPSRLVHRLGTKAAL